MSAIHELVDAALGSGPWPERRRNALNGQGGPGRSVGTDYKNPERLAKAAVLGPELRSVEPDMLHGAELTDGGREIQREKALHRLMIYLAASGLSNIAVAERVGVHPNTVGYILAQPWAKLQLVQELKDAGKDVVSEMLKRAAEDSVATLLEVRDNPAEKGATRVAAANSLLDRFLGKPVARVEISKGTPSLDDITKIDDELARLRLAQAALPANGEAVSPGPSFAVSPATPTQVP